MHWQHCHFWNHAFPDFVLPKEGWRCPCFRADPVCCGRFSMQMTCVDGRNTERHGTVISGALLSTLRADCTGANSTTAPAPIGRFKCGVCTRVKERGDVCAVCPCLFPTPFFFWIQPSRIMPFAVILAHLPSSLWSLGSSVFRMHVPNAGFEWCNSSVSKRADLTSSCNARCCAYPRPVSFSTILQGVAASTLNHLFQNFVHMPLSHTLSHTQAF
mmetsp:Transcript_89892/g.150236  ORF Transcript_89892/g.150236 Transcript_89892/m.150236 type:complete len:215 (-) Transcript_89892:198-842(-)